LMNTQEDPRLCKPSLRRERHFVESKVSILLPPKLNAFDFDLMPMSAQLSHGLLLEINYSQADC